MQHAAGLSPTGATGASCAAPCSMQDPHPEEEPEEGASLTVRAVVARYCRHLLEIHDAGWHDRNGTRLKCNRSV